MDFDPPEFFSERWLYGRKVHACVECLRVIGRGEFHHTASGKWDGDVETFRTCAHCIVLARWVSRAHSDDGYPIGQVLWEVYERLRDGVGGLDVARAYAAARRLRWRSKRTGRLLDVPPRLVVPPYERAGQPDRLFKLHRHPGDWRFTPQGWASFDSTIRLREDIERARGLEVVR